MWDSIFNFFFGMIPHKIMVILVVLMTLFIIYLAYG